MAQLSERDRQAVSLFVDEMRAAREAQGWSQAELARRTNYSSGLIGMVETYERAPTKELARALDKVFETAGYSEDPETAEWTPGTFSRLWEKLRTISFPTAFRPFAEREANAVALRTYEHSFVPGLLQTADYARAVVSTKAGATETDIEADVSDRIARQWILTREDPPPPRLWALIDEGALYRPVAPATVMHDQLEHVTAMSMLPNVTVQVVPYSAGGHGGLLGAFIVADLPTSQSILYMDDASGGRVAEETATVSEVAYSFDTVRSDALPKTASLDLIAKVNKERWTA
jgi:transcriptional regulator with XRE-family HTH domain